MPRSVIGRSIAVRRRLASASRTTRCHRYTCTSTHWSDNQVMQSGSFRALSTSKLASLNCCTRILAMRRSGTHSQHCLRLHNVRLQSGMVWSCGVVTLSRLYESLAGRMGLRLSYERSRSCQEPSSTGIAKTCEHVQDANPPNPLRTPVQSHEEIDNTSSRLCLPMPAPLQLHSLILKSPHPAHSTPPSSSSLFRLTQHPHTRPDLDQTSQDHLSKPSRPTHHQEPAYELEIANQYKHALTHPTSNMSLWGMRGQRSMSSNTSERQPESRRSSRSCLRASRLSLPASFCALEPALLASPSRPLTPSRTC